MPLTKVVHLLLKENLRNNFTLLKMTFKLTQISLILSSWRCVNSKNSAISLKNIHQANFVPLPWILYNQYYHTACSTQGLLVLVLYSLLYQVISDCNVNTLFLLFRNSAYHRSWRGVLWGRCLWENSVRSLSGSNIQCFCLPRPSSCLYNSFRACRTT